MINSVPKKSRELSEEVEAQTKAFLKAGGKILVCGSEANANKAVKVGDFSINSAKAHLRNGDIKPPTDPKTVK